MKYSFLMPYYDRIVQLKNTLESFRRFYSSRRSDYEVVIIENGKNFVDVQMHLDLISTSVQFADIPMKVVKTNIKPQNPAPLFNMGARMAHGDIFILTNPECKHAADVLSGLDQEFDDGVNDKYVVCACESLLKDGSHHMWYQHSQHRNKLYHFCAAIHNSTYWMLGGFPDEFADGYCYDDDAWIWKVQNAGLNIVTRDDLLVQHQWHTKHRPENWKELLERNKQRYLKLISQ